MTWTYGNPAAKAKDAVRLAIGDTRPDEPLLQDFEINYFLAQSNNGIASAAIKCVRAIIAKLSRDVDERTGELSLSSSQAAAGYSKMLATLQQQLALGGAVGPYAGGISKADIAVQRANPDWNRPDFSTDMMRSPYVAKYLGLPSNGVWQDYEREHIVG